MTKPTKHCRIFGVGTCGPLAGVFPNIAAFRFEVLPRRVDVTGFVERTEVAIAADPVEATMWIPEARVPAAKKAIVEEYGKRWKKLVVLKAPVAPVKVRAR